MDKEQSEKHYKRLKLRGIVQGVGFRPHVKRLAERYGIRGSVRNLGGEVEILCCGDKELDFFIEGVLSAPFPARVDICTTEEVPPFDADGFDIASSGQSDTPRLVPPDIAICPQCLSELEERGRRRGYFFNTCTACGPRYTVIESLPYDRENTSMRHFEMCPQCGREYTDLNDRRLKAETISCLDCGPRLYFTDGKDELTGQEAFNKAVNVLQSGGVIAIKGIGGYHLACSPYMYESTERLRLIKGREGKPFAVMFPDMDAVKTCCTVTPPEEELLRSPAAPIVLLPVKDNSFTQTVLNGDLYCGCFLPYTPLHKLLLKKTGALVMTSANAVGQGIISDEHSIFDFLKKHTGQLSGVLYNDRRIIRSAEDSVVQHISCSGNRIIRRARGYVPEPFMLNNPSGQDFFAAGGDLKSSFCLVSGDRAYASPYLGDLEDAGVYKRYTDTIKDYESLFGICHRLAVCDMHPAYFSSDYAKGLGLPVLQVQHHHAHIAGVMAEYGIEQPVIGASFDGTGYGEDGAVWGGEFLICSGADYKRVGHLKYVRMLGSDASAKDAALSASCYLSAAGMDFSSHYGEGSGLLRAALDSGIGVVESSSMGRLFDAVSALLGISRRNTYEGECAVLLQREGEKALKNGIKPYPLCFDVYKTFDGIEIGWEDIIRTAHAGKRDVGAIALGFHIALSVMVSEVFSLLRDESGINKAVLSGGVFQNGLLMELCIAELKRMEFEVHINKKSPPNDGGIALGQAYIGARRK